MRIVISDDHPLVLMGLRTLLRERGEAYCIVGEATSPAELLSVLSATPCDLLITDFSMARHPDEDDGVAFLQSVREEFPKLPVLVVTMVTNPALMRGMLATGIRGIVDKWSMSGELITAIGAVLAGRRYLCNETRKRLEAHTLLPGAATSACEAAMLSLGQVQVIRQLAQGRTLTQIAESTGRSVKTISQHKRDAMRKLGLDSDSQLYHYARSSQLT